MVAICGVNFCCGACYNKIMKIAITSDLCLEMTNGVTTFARTLAEGLAATGHDVMAISPSPTGKKYRRVVHYDQRGQVVPPGKVRQSQLGGKITYVYLRSAKLHIYPDQIHAVPAQKELLGHKLPRVFYKNGLRWSPWPGRQITRALNRFHPDVIHNQTAETVAYAVLHYARKHQIPLVSTGHAYPDNITGQLKLINKKPLLWAKKSLDGLLKWWMNSFLRHSEYATMPTQLAIDDLIPKNRQHFTVPVEALSNGINLSAFKPGPVPATIRKRYGIPAGRPTVLYVGRLDGEKSVHVVLDAFKLVLEQVPRARLVVVGDGVAKNALEDQARTLGIASQTLFLGKVTPPDVYDLYRAGDVFATASETETQGIVLIEAAASGLPIVAVDKGAVRELCQNNRNGLLCTPRDTAGIAQAITRILQDTKLRRRFSAGSLEVAAQHDFNHTLKRFVEIYQEAIRIKQEKQA